MTKSEQLKEYFISKGVKQQEVADTCGFKKSFVSELLNGKRTIGYETAAKLANAFDELNPEWLITGEGEMLRGNTQTIGDNSNHNSKSIGSDCSKCPLGDQLREKDRQIGELQQMINKLMEKI